MKRITALIFAFVISAPVLAFGQDVQLPDYTKWKKDYSEKVSVSLNGKNVELLQERYEDAITTQQTDFNVLKQQVATVICNEQGNSWFALYVSIHYKGEQQMSEAHVYLFENKNNKWVLIKDFSDSQKTQKKLTEFFWKNYKLKAR
ncbi:MAG: hypothetical protein HY505_00880 [Candidatus Yanofskybacteria bacterium]|nr:hypothetical protein [Candidatus Yanofskybacteria bacterium]